MAERSSANRSRSAVDNDHPVRLPSVSSPTSTAPSTPSLASKPDAPSSLSHASPSARYISRALIPLFAVEPFHPEAFSGLTPPPCPVSSPVHQPRSLALLHTSPQNYSTPIAWGNAAHIWVLEEDALVKKKRKSEGIEEKRDEELLGRGHFFSVFWQPLPCGCASRGRNEIQGD